MRRTVPFIILIIVTFPFLFCSHMQNRDGNIQRVTIDNKSKAEVLSSKQSLEIFSKTKKSNDRILESEKPFLPENVCRYGPYQQNLN